MGFRHQGFRYHSSFLLADARDAFVLETAGPYWALERVRGARSISNGLSITTPDEVHPQAADEARRRGFLRFGAEFDFTACFGSRLYRLVSGAPARAACTRRRLDSVQTPSDVMAALRQHTTPHPADGFTLHSPCAHASGLPTRAAGQTTASFVARLSPQGASYWATGTSSPCLSVFKPIDFRGTPPWSTAPVEADAFSLFWRHERLHRRVQGAWAARAPRVQALTARLESALLHATPEEAWAQHVIALPRLLEATVGPDERGHPWARAYWRKQCRRDGL
jgi:dipeptidase